MTNEQLENAKELIECNLIAFEGDESQTQKMYIRAMTLQAR